LRKQVESRKGGIAEKIHISPIQWSRENSTGEWYVGCGVCVLWGFLNALRAYMKVVKQNGGGFSFVYSPLCLTFLSPRSVPDSIPTYTGIYPAFQNYKTAERDIWQIWWNEKRIDSIALSQLDSADKPNRFDD